MAPRVRVAHLNLGVLLVLLAASGVNSVSQPSYDDSVQMIEDEEFDVLLDVRSRDEYEKGHIEGAVLMEDVDLSTCTEHKVAVYCWTGYDRSTPAAHNLESNGFSDVYDLGGLQYLSPAGAPVVAAETDPDAEPYTCTDESSTDTPTNSTANDPSPAPPPSDTDSGGASDANSPPSSTPAGSPTSDARSDGAHRNSKSKCGLGYQPFLIGGILFAFAMSVVYMCCSTNAPEAKVEPGSEKQVEIVGLGDGYGVEKGEAIAVPIEAQKLGGIYTTSSVQSQQPDGPPVQDGPVLPPLAYASGPGPGTAHVILGPASAALHLPRIAQGPGQANAEPPIARESALAVPVSANSGSL
mmetsp:Transcript_18397/g.48541  ORF Transcript_18397/g.48541 Transcript_18397/m.48541 type:complete len:353 (+) Transcript_18397:139-1197(+)